MLGGTFQVYIYKSVQILAYFVLHKKLVQFVLSPPMGEGGATYPSKYAPDWTLARVNSLVLVQFDRPTHSLEPWILATQRMFTESSSLLQCKQHNMILADSLLVLTVNRSHRRVVCRISFGKLYFIRVRFIRHYSHVIAPAILDDDDFMCMAASWLYTEKKKIKITKKNKKQKRGAMSANWDI